MPTGYKQKNNPQTLYKVIYSDDNGALLEKTHSVLPTQLGQRVWYTTEGIKKNLVEYEPPKEIKIRRFVQTYSPSPDGYATTSFTSYLNGINTIGEFELTIVDGVLTDVEIVSSKGEI